MQDGTDLSEREHVILALRLCLLVLLGIESEILKWQLCVLRRSSELRQSHVASREHEVEVRSPTLLVEEEALFAPHAQPVEELQTDLDQLQICKLSISFSMLIVVPDEAYYPDQEAGTPLQRLDLGELWDRALVVEMLDPASKVLDHKDEVVDDDHVWSELFWKLSEIVEECNDVRQADELWDPQALLSQQSA